MQFGLWIVALLLFLAGCQSEPDNFITGKWGFDRMSVAKGADLSAKDSLDVIAMQTQWGLNLITWEFSKDKTFTQTEPGGKITGDYEIINDGKEMLLHTPGYDPKKIQLITLTNTELAMGDVQVPYITHWKKQKQ